jgi:hypothetical protein
MGTVGSWPVKRPSNHTYIGRPVFLGAVWGLFRAKTKHYKMARFFMAAKFEEIC